MKLVTKHFDKTLARDVKVPMKRVVVVDCSGSMSGELPKLRTHLKNKLPTMVAPEDTISLIWFSGRNEAGFIFQDLQINSALDLATVNTAIDRFLKPIGLTGFKEPLNLVVSMAVKDSDMPISLTFMTDGGENQSPKSEIIEVCSKLSNQIATSVMVSYGYYADEKFLNQMAEELGGEMIGAGDFQSYVDLLDRSLNTRASSKKLVATNLPTTGLIVGHLESSYVTVKANASGQGTFPSNTIAYSYLEGSGELDLVEDEYAAVQVVGALIQRGEADVAVQLAGLIGDEELFKTVQNAFSKQDYNRVVSMVGPYQPFVTAPRNTNLKQDPNAYNVLTLLMDLAEQEGNYLHISHPEFVYSAIGSKRNAIPDENGFVPKFTNKDGEVKAAITTLKFDSDRPNISILTRRDGQVSLPDNDFGFGNSIDSFIWRNYAIVRDGIVNVKKLPVVLTKASHDLLTMNGIPLEPFKVNTTYVIDVSKMPVINRSMTTPMTAAEICKMQFEIYNLQVSQKIINSNIEKPEASAEFSSKYGEDATLFLKKYGVTPGGFGPKTEAGESVDPYIAKALVVKLGGLSSIPKIEDVKADVLAGKKLTASKKIVADKLKQLENITDFVQAKQAIKTNLCKANDAMVKAKFGIILGKKIFTDMKNWDDNTIEIDFGFDKPLTCTVSLVDIQI